MMQSGFPNEAWYHAVPYASIALLISQAALILPWEKVPAGKKRCAQNQGITQLLGVASADVQAGAHYFNGILLALNHLYGIDAPVRAASGRRSNSF